MPAVLPISIILRTAGDLILSGISNKERLAEPKNRLKIRCAGIISNKPGAIPHAVALAISSGVACSSLARIRASPAPVAVPNVPTVPNCAALIPAAPAPRALAPAPTIPPGTINDPTDPSAEPNLPATESSYPGATSGDNESTIDRDLSTTASSISVGSNAAAPSAAVPNVPKNPRGIPLTNSAA